MPGCGLLRPGVPSPSPAASQAARVPACVPKASLLNAARHPAARPQGIREYEPRVLQQLMDFMYRYTAEILQDAEVGGALCCIWGDSCARGVGLPTRMWGGSTGGT